jgi:hypothetical protein
MMLVQEKLWGEVGEEILKFKGREESRKKESSEAQNRVSLTTKALPLEYFNSHGSITSMQVSLVLMVVALRVVLNGSGPDVIWIQHNPASESRPNQMALGHPAAFQMSGNVPPPRFTAIERGHIGAGSRGARLSALSMRRLLRTLESPDG